jgi:cytochrome c nitrite reductase small subunit
LKKIKNTLLNLIQFFYPPKKWRVSVIIMLGFFAGLFAFLFHISKAHTYLNDKPETCVNCHIMAPQYTTWFHGSHGQFTTCNDCHVPQDNFFRHYYFKATDGLRHSYVFTLRNEPQVIYIHRAGKKVVQENCMRCHNDLIVDYKTGRYTDLYNKNRMNRNCNECHKEVAHGRGNSLSSVPNARVPLMKSAVPSFLKKKK